MGVSGTAVHLLLTVLRIVLRISLSSSSQTAQTEILL